MGSMGVPVWSWPFLWALLLSHLDNWKAIKDSHVPAHTHIFTGRTGHHFLSVVPQATFWSLHCWKLQCWLVDDLLWWVWVFLMVNFLSLYKTEAYKLHEHKKKHVFWIGVHVVFSFSRAFSISKETLRDLQFLVLLHLPHFLQPETDFNGYQAFVQGQQLV